VLAVIPPKDAFGSTGNPQAGIKGHRHPRLRGGPDQGLQANASASGQHVSSGGSGLPKVTASTGAAPQIKVPSASRRPSW
jgi:peptidylprolyl isomerase